MKDKKKQRAPEQTSFKYSIEPDTGNALVTNLATDCMFINPFQIGLRRERKSEVFPS